MPSFIFAKNFGSADQTIDAILCSPHAVTGVPDRRTDVPVKIRRVNDRVLAVDGENRGIISCTGMNGTATFLVGGGSQHIRNRERRGALARASTLLKELTVVLRPLATASEEPEAVIENLQALFDWIAEERERLTVAA